jgi:hypothetical protein
VFSRSSSRGNRAYVCPECRRPVMRRAGSGLYVEETQLEGGSMFRVREFPAAVYCIDAMKAFIQSQDYTNITFWEAGETFAP